jgi:hypothetical protein
MDALIRVMREMHNDPMNTSMFWCGGLPTRMSILQFKRASPFFAFGVGKLFVSNTERDAALI